MNLLKLNYTYLLSGAIVLLVHFTAISQETYEGIISDELGAPISQAIVILVQKETSKQLQYTLSDSAGKYSLFYENTCTACFLKFTKLGYSAVTLETGTLKQTYDVTLKEKEIALEEVIINAPTRAITIKKDTIIFNAASFADGTETVAEDLLRKIPGISISDDGTIKIGNREVEKVMIENDDFFEKGYKTLTKNLPAAPIEKVEILQRYSNNKLLKGIEESDKVALNLTLNDESKRQWFGNIDLGYGLASENRYDSRANLLNFGKKNKYYFFTNLNNVGYDATGDIDNLIRSNRAGEPGGIGDSEQVRTLVNFSNSIPYFEESRFRFNNAELLSLNAIFNPTEKLKIKTIGFANWDELAFFRNSTDRFVANQTNFTNTEDFTLKSNFVTLFGKIDLSYDLSKTATFEVVSKYSNTETSKRSDLLFNNAPRLQGLAQTNNRFDQKIAYSKKFKNNNALLITGRYIQEASPQTFTVSQNNFATLFDGSNTPDTISQQSAYRYQYAGAEAHWLDRKKNGNLFEIKAGSQLRADELQSDFSIINPAGSTITPAGFQNNLTYSVHDTYISSKYLYKFSKKWSVFALVNGHLITNRIDNRLNPTASDTETVFFINPSLNSALKINDKNKIVLSTSLSRRNAGITEVYDNFALTGFRNFSRGTGSFNQLDASSVSLVYTLGNWSDRFFANAFVTYTKSFDFFSTSSQINQDFTLSETVLFKDQELLSANLNVDNYLTFINSNLKGTFSYTSLGFQNIVNDSPIREITSNTYSYGAELRSGFSGLFNYHIGSTWRTSSIRSEGFENNFTNNKSFVDLFFVLSKKLNFTVASERYFFGNLETDNTYYFADLTGRYDFKKNKLSLSLSGKNLFNTEIFREFSINDLGSSTTEYRLLPRYVLLKLTYRF